MSWIDVVVPLLIGIVPAILTYLATRRQLRVERERIAAETEAKRDEVNADRRTSSEAALVQVSGGAGDVVSLLRAEVRRISDELADARIQITGLQEEYEVILTERDALLDLVETTGRRNDDLSNELERMGASINILRSDMATCNRKVRDLLRQNAILIGIAEKTLTQ